MFILCKPSGNRVWKWKKILFHFYFKSPQINRKTVLCPGKPHKMQKIETLDQLGVSRLVQHSFLCGKYIWVSFLKDTRLDRERWDGGMFISYQNQKQIKCLWMV